MQVTIDSTESLDEVLAVLSTMFGTRIVPDPADAATTSGTAAPAAPGKTAKAVKTARSAAGSKRPVSSKKTPAVDASAVRAWARGQGTTVTERGALPKKLIAAYEAAQA